MGNYKADFLEEIFGSPTVAAFFLLITAGLLVAGEKMLSGDKEIPKMDWKDAMIIGLFQSFALFPGISRSGSTITGGLWRGLDRETAARYSFLLGVPAITGAGLLSILDLQQSGTLDSRKAPAERVMDSNDLEKERGISVTSSVISTSCRTGSSSGSSMKRFFST